MTLLNKPDFNIGFEPIMAYSYRSDGSTNKSTLGLKTGRRVTENRVGVRRRKPGTRWIAPTPYTFTRVDHRASLGYSKQMPTGVPSPLYGTHFEPVVGATPGETARFLNDNAMNPALTEANAKVDSGLRNSALIAARNRLKTTNIDLGVAFAERKQTADLLAGTATRIANSVRNLKRGNVRKAMDELGISSKKRQPRGSNVPSKWLEMQYGWKPLLADVYGSADSLAKRERSDWRVTSRATRSSTTNHNYEYGSGTGSWSNVKVEVKRSVFARIDCFPANELLVSLSSLGVLNPLLVAWERVPFSFVVDWAFPLGNWLDSLDATFGYTCLGYSNSLLVRAEWVITGKSGPYGTSGKISNVFSGSKKMVHLDRQVSTSVPLPTLPSLKRPDSLGHMANALALLAGAFGR